MCRCSLWTNPGKCCSILLFDGRALSGGYIDQPMVDQGLLYEIVDRKPLHQVDNFFEHANSPGTRALVYELLSNTVASIDEISSQRARKPMALSVIALQNVDQQEGSPMVE